MTNTMPTPKPSLVPCEGVQCGRTAAAKKPRTELGEDHRHVTRRPAFRPVLCTELRFSRGGGMNGTAEAIADVVTAIAGYALVLLWICEGQQQAHDNRRFHLWSPPSLLVAIAGAAAPVANAGALIVVPATAGGENIAAGVRRRRHRSC